MPHGFLGFRSSVGIRRDSDRRRMILWERPAFRGYRAFCCYDFGIVFFSRSRWSIDRGQTILRGCSRGSRLAPALPESRRKRSSHRINAIDPVPANNLACFFFLFVSFFSFSLFFQRVPLGGRQGNSRRRRRPRCSGCSTMLGTLRDALRSLGLVLRKTKRKHPKKINKGRSA